MKRLAIAIAFFMTACLLCVGGYFILKDTNEDLDNLLTESITCAQHQDIQGLEASNARLMQKWNQSELIFSVMLQHSHLDDFERRIQMLDYYFAQGDYEKYIETSQEARNELTHIMESERLSLGNIF